MSLVDHIFMLVSEMDKLEAIRAKKNGRNDAIFQINFGTGQNIGHDFQ